LSLFLLTLFAFKAQALEPAWKLRTLNSPHFEIIYREEQKELARRYIMGAEQAREVLKPVFSEMPEKTIIFLKDDTDSSNGLATFIPYPHITVYPVLPTSLDSVDDYGDWVFEMVLHEYTHILNMYPAHGLYVPFTYIFGTIVRPNAVLPRWWLEGLAVNLESALSTHGRLKASETQAAARALALEDRFKGEDVARINQTDLKTWPYGARPYLYGAWWWDQVRREKGLPVIEAWNQNFSRRLPFFLEGPVYEQTSKTPGEFLKHTFDGLEEQGKKQIEAIKQAGSETATSVAEPRGEQLEFAISPSGQKLVYWLSVPESGSEARLKERPAGSTESFDKIPSRRLFKSVGSVRVQWLDENRFVYDQTDIQYPHTSFRDLYIYNLETGRRERLTTRARAQEPAPSPKATRIAFIQNEGGKNSLMLMEMKDRKISPLVRGNFSQRLSWPGFLNEDEILFVVRQKSGSEKLKVVNVNTMKVSAFTEDLNDAQNPQVTAAGVFVTDAKTHVRNVYQVQDGRVKARSNTLTDIQTVDWDPLRQEILFSELTGEGRRLKALPLKDFNPPTLEQPKWNAPPKASITKVKIEEGSYQPIEYLIPRYWMPFAYQVEDGMLFQGTTQVQDPAGRNAYALQASFDTITHKPSYGASYINSSTPVDIGLNYAKSVNYLGASGIEVDSTAAGADFTYPFSRFMQGSVGGIFRDTERGRFAYKRMGPEVWWRYSRLDNPLNERFGYHAELSHQEYTEQSGYISYGRSYAYLAAQARTFGNQRLFIQARGALAPKLPARSVLTLGEPNVGGNYLVNLANSQFLLRGYPSGAFMGRKILSGNLEYSFPLTDLDRGFGTFPLFLRGLEFAVFGDVLAADGAAFDVEREAYATTRLSENYMGTGGEFRLNTTSFYHLPVSLTVGLYYGFNERFGGGLATFVGFGLGGLNPLEK
jgi:hypothetical protein